MTESADSSAVPAPGIAPTPGGGPGDPAGTVAEPIAVGQMLQAVCSSCGAQVGYAPGTSSLRCPRCGTEQDIATLRPVAEHSYDEWAALKSKPVAQIGAMVLQCQNCGASTETDQLAGTCKFCRGPLVPVEHPDGLVAPEAVVPFGVAKNGATDAFRAWARSRHFAPGAMKKVSSTDSISGTYIPHWTFDARTATDYEGQRGDYYYTTETRTVSDGKGGSRTETYQQRHTRWRQAQGHVERAFDDVLVPASDRVPPKKLAEMGPWELGRAQAFQPTYLAGFSALRYDVDPDAGLAIAQDRMQRTITQDCERDIGGDEQRVGHLDVRYAALMFKLVLLPLWIATYGVGAKTFNVYINANTGEVVGERPYSAVKIVAFVFAMLVLAAAIAITIIAIRR